MFHARWAAQNVLSWRQFSSLTLLSILAFFIVWMFARLNPRASPPTLENFLMMLVPCSALLVWLPFWTGRKFARRWSLFVKWFVCIHVHNIQMPLERFRAFAWGRSDGYVFLVLRAKNQRQASRIIGLPEDVDQKHISKTLLDAGLNEERLEVSDDGWKAYL